MVTLSCWKCGKLLGVSYQEPNAFQENFRQYLRCSDCFFKLYNKLHDLKFIKNMPDW